ncbi:MAG: hypothetical protein IPP29_11670 [Bacteroidetes bacterium]|nr:hypothetical protein [Bacteroidota bacterium]
MAIPTKTAQGLSAGTYTVTATDAAGCKKQPPYSNEPAIRHERYTNDVTTNGGSDGAID